MSSFQITNPNVRLPALKPGESSDVTYTVANVSGGPRRAAFRIQVKSPTGVYSEASSGYTFKGGQNISEFAVGATQQVTVVVAPSASAAAGTNTFRLFVGLVNQEDTDFDVGPEVTYDVTSAPKPAFPWWIVAVAVVLLALVGGGIAFMVTRPSSGPAPTPNPVHSFIIIDPCLKDPALCRHIVPLHK